MHEYDLILTLTGGLAAALVLWVMRYPSAHALNPHVQVLARAPYLRDVGC